MYDLRAVLQGQDSRSIQETWMPAVAELIAKLNFLHQLVQQIVAVLGPIAVHDEH